LLYTAVVSDWVGEEDAAAAADAHAPHHGLTLAVLAASLGLMWLPPALSLLILLGVIS
jgi:hypothetical protein